MGLKSKTGIFPSFSGRITAEVPTPTYSGTSDPVDASVSINPFTGQGPGPGGAGQTTAEIAAERAGEGAPITTPTSWNASRKSGNCSLSNSNLTATFTQAGYGVTHSAFGTTSGKYYWEITVNSTNGSVTDWMLVGISNDTSGTTSDWAGQSVSNGLSGYRSSNTHSYHDTLLSPSAGRSYGVAYQAGAVIGVALDLDNRNVFYHTNGSWEGGATLSEIVSGDGTNAALNSLIGGVTFHANVQDAGNNNFGVAFTANFGQNDFVHSVPAGFSEGFGA